MTDEHGLTGTDQVAITAEPEQENQPPTVVLPDVVTVNSGQQFSITADASDPDGDPLVYVWSIDSVLTVVSGSQTASVTLKAPVVEANGEYPVQVNVNDGALDTFASMRVLVKADNQGGDSCDNTDPDAGNYPSWNSTTTYTNETVSHNGLVYRAKWWNQNVEPAQSAESWEL